MIQKGYYIFRLSTDRTPSTGGVSTIDTRNKDKLYWIFV